MFIRILAFLSIKWALMFITSKMDYMGSDWLNSEVKRKGL